MGEIKDKWGRGPCVYFITDGKYVKIGATRNLEVRFSDIQSMNSAELKILHVIHTLDIFRVESFFHIKYRDKHIRGEWYDVEKEVYELIEKEKQAEAMERETIKRKREEAEAERKRRREEKITAIHKAMEEKEQLAKEKEWAKYPNYLTVEQIAKCLKIPLNLAKRLVNVEDFPKMELVGTEERVTIGDFNAFIEKHKEGKVL